MMPRIRLTWKDLGIALAQAAVFLGVAFLSLYVLINLVAIAGLWMLGGA
jgi:hypothetical protein